jgi:FkbM family methyltransferase
VRSLPPLIVSVIPTGLPLPIVAGPLRGMKWIAGAAAGQGKGLSVVVNRSEALQLRVARSIVSRSDTAFDVGANVGVYTLLFARYSRRVFAFEPLPRNVRYLHRTLQLNRVSNATIVPWALSDGVGLTSLREGSNAALGTLDPSGGQPCATTSCDAFVSTYGVAPDVMKVDVEGAELSVLQGAVDTLNRARPTILLSTHGEVARSACLTFLQELAYQVRPLDGTDPDRASEFLCAVNRPLRSRATG